MVSELIDRNSLTVILYLDSKRGKCSECENLVAEMKKLGKRLERIERVVPAIKHFYRRKVMMISRDQFRVFILGIGKSRFVCCKSSFNG